VIFQLDVVHSLPTKLLQKYWMKKITFFRLPGDFKVIQTPQIGAGGISGLTEYVSVTSQNPYQAILDFSHSDHYIVQGTSYYERTKTQGRAEFLIRN
jgi:hypothetical protein